MRGLVPHFRDDPQIGGDARILGGIAAYGRRETPQALAERNHRERRAGVRIEHTDGRVGAPPGERAEREERRRARRGVVESGRNVEHEMCTPQRVARKVVAAVQRAETHDAGAWIGPRQRCVGRPRIERALGVFVVEAQHPVQAVRAGDVARSRPVLAPIVRLAVDVRAGRARRHERRTATGRVQACGARERIRGRALVGLVVVRSHAREPGTETLIRKTGGGRDRRCGREHE